MPMTSVLTEKGKQMIREYIYFVDDNPNGTSGMTDEEIVRCKECKHWSYSDLIESHNRCERTMKLTKPDDFCSHGEREGE